MAVGIADIAAELVVAQQAGPSSAVAAEEAAAGLPVAAGSGHLDTYVLF